MEAVAIKILKGYYAGRYYAGSHKNPSATLLGAQLYHSYTSQERPQRRQWKLQLTSTSQKMK